MVQSFRYKKGKFISLEYRYYISSKTLTAEQAASAIREHWGIESMHWVLDVSMSEDACQIYKGEHRRKTKALLNEYINVGKGVNCRIV